MMKKEKQISELEIKRTEGRKKVSALDAELAQAFAKSEEKAQEMVKLASGAKEKFNMLRSVAEVMPHGSDKGTHPARVAEIFGLSSGKAPQPGPTTKGRKRA